MGEGKDILIVSCGEGEAHDHIAQSPCISSIPGHEGEVHADILSAHGTKHRIVFNRLTNVFNFIVSRDDRVRCVLRLDELLAVKKFSVPIRSGVVQEFSEKEPTPSTLFFYFVHRKDKKKWRIFEIPCIFNTRPERDFWERLVHVALSSASQRPRSIVVYINPFGGKGKAPNIYKKFVDPVFQLAGISLRVVFTEYANHAKEDVERMEEHAWRSIDGIVSVGGDGLFNECLSGALNRTHAEEDVDMDNRRNLLHSPRLRFGIIGAGSANSIVMTVHHTDDYFTSAIHIAIGSSCRVDACTVHEKGRLVRVAADAISYGWLGDVLRDSERYRSCGPFRYQWSALRTTARNPSYRGLLSFTLSPTEAADPSLKLPQCAEGCVRCAALSRSNGTSSPSEGDSGALSPSATEHPFHCYTDFSHIICCVIPCVTPFTPLGLAPFTGIGDGSLDLAILPQLSVCNNLNFMRIAAQYGGKGLYERMPSLNCYRVTSWSFKPDDDVEDKGMWNVDGELVEQPAELLHFRLHPRLISFFGRDTAVIPPTSLHLSKRKSSIVYHS